MMIIEQLNDERQFIIYRISKTDVLVKEGVESWLEVRALQSFTNVLLQVCLSH